MSSPLPLPLPPPPQQPQPQVPSRFHRRPFFSSLPDLIFTSFSLFYLVSSPRYISCITSIPKLSFPLNNPRRFFRIPNMAFPASTSTPRNTPNFSTPQSLSDWLKPRLPSDSFASWGVKPGTKNIHNLWLELSEGETSLADSTPPIRTVEVVIVRIIGKENKILVESHQELSNGDIRQRSRPLSEKMKPGESVEAAVRRAVKEELGSIITGRLGSFAFFGDNDIVRIVPDSYSKKVEERASESYPGLPARYVLHTVDAIVEGLPETEFFTEEDEEYEESDGKKLADGALLCKKHYWKWTGP